MFDLDKSYWKLIDRIGPELFNEVVSATYSYRDDSLWILDRDTRDPSQVTTRLLRVEPATGSWDEVYRTDPVPLDAGSYDERTLGIDADGNVLITGSNGYPQRHRIASITARAGGYDFSVTSCRQRGLVSGTGVRPDLQGFVLYFQQDWAVDDTCLDDPQPALGGPSERLTALPLHAAAHSEMEDLLR